MTRRGSAIMVQGTASSVGKSILVTGLCRLFSARGLRVAPFKSQNMALNSAVTADGGEIGRAQAVQAEACGIPATIEMNPVLLKPEADARAQVVVLGKPIGSMSAAEYHDKKPELLALIAQCLAELRKRHDLVIIEGAGSPAEVNLRDRDIVNMTVAELADAPVLLVGDIDRGGVFASLVGTMELLLPEHQRRIAAFVINKFRGDRSLLDSGLAFLEERTGVPVLGVVPHLGNLSIAEEDSLSLDLRGRSRPRESDELDVAVIRLPRISNYDDVAPLEREPGVNVRYVDCPADLELADLAILPGSKSTAADLMWLRQRGLAAAIYRRVQRRLPTIGLCGGCQMLGHKIVDPHQIESSAEETAGLGLLPLVTTFTPRKITCQITARLVGRCFFSADYPADAGLLRGYEIHMGIANQLANASAFAVICERNGAGDDTFDGAVDESGFVMGTMIHGLFANEPLRRALLVSLRRLRGLPEPPLPVHNLGSEAAYDRLAAALEAQLRPDLLRRIVGM